MFRWLCMRICYICILAAFAFVAHPQLCATSNRPTIPPTMRRSPLDHRVCIARCREWTPINGLCATGGKVNEWVGGLSDAARSIGAHKRVINKSNRRAIWISIHPQFWTSHRYTHKDILTPRVHLYVAPGRHNHIRKYRRCGCKPVKPRGSTSSISSRGNSEPGIFPETRIDSGVGH